MFKKYIFILFGIFIVGYILFIRLAINKLPRNLPLIDSIFKFVLYSLIPLCFLFIAISLFIKHHKKKSVNIVPEYWLKKLNIVSVIYWKSLLSLNEFIVENTPPRFWGENLMQFSSVYTTYLGLKKKKYYIIIYILLAFVPKIVFLLLFLYDVLYLKKFTYIYYYGWILLIPLAFNYLLFTLKEFSEYNFDNYIKNILLVITDGDVLIENVEILIESCKKFAVELYFINTFTTRFYPELYAQICDKYLEDNNITDDNEIDRVSQLRREEFTTLRVVYTQMIIFGFICDRYNNILNSIYYAILAIIWFYIIIC